MNMTLSANAECNNVLNLGFPDTYAGQGAQAEMLSQWGLDADGMLKSIQNRLANLNASNCQ